MAVPQNIQTNYMSAISYGFVAYDDIETDYFINGYGIMSFGLFIAEDVWSMCEIVDDTSWTACTPITTTTWTEC